MGELFLYFFLPLFIRSNFHPSLFFPSLNLFQSRFHSLRFLPSVRSLSLTLLIRALDSSVQYHVLTSLPLSPVLHFYCSSSCLRFSEENPPFPRVTLFFSLSLSRRAKGENKEKTFRQQQESPAFLFLYFTSPSLHFLCLLPLFLLVNCSLLFSPFSSVASSLYSFIRSLVILPETRHVHHSSSSAAANNYA